MDRQVKRVELKNNEECFAVKMTEVSYRKIEIGILLPTAKSGTSGLVADVV